MSSYTLLSPSYVKAVEDKPTLQLSSKGIKGAGLATTRNDADLIYNCSDNWVPFGLLGSEGNKNCMPVMGMGFF